MSSNSTTSQAVLGASTGAGLLSAILGNWLLCLCCICLILILGLIFIFLTKKATEEEEDKKDKKVNA